MAVKKSLVLLFLPFTAFFLSPNAHAETGYFFCFSEPRDNTLYITGVWSINVGSVYRSSAAVASEYDRFMQSRYDVASYHSSCEWNTEGSVQGALGEIERRRVEKIDHARRWNKSVVSVGFSHGG